jgi:hypothetical protein
MTSISKAPSLAVFRGTPDAFTAIHAPETTLALWVRPPQRRIRLEAARLAARAPLTITAEEKPDRIGAELTAALPSSAPALVADAAMLARRFAAAASANRVHLRLEALASIGCPLFHADQVGLRLLVTYVGKGTEWVPEHAVDRSALGSGDNRAIVPDPRFIRRVAPFTVALFKGEAYPGNRGKGVVHRSPPADSRRPRLLLCLDEPGRF